MQTPRLDDPIVITPPGQPALVVANCNQKGGVGKTTSTCNLSRALALAALRVLVVDLDPQGNATSALSATALAKDDIGLADALTPGAEYELRQVIVPTIWTGVDLAPTPGEEALSEAESRLAATKFGREKRLATVLAPVVGEYDVILIDNTPALGLLLINALAAAELALVITQPEQWSADGLDALHDTIDEVTQHYNTGLRTVGPLINGKRRSAHHDRIAAEICAHYGSSAWSADEDMIPLRSAIADQLLAGRGLDEGDAKLRFIAAAYRRFGERLLTAGGRI